MISSYKSKKTVVINPLFNNCVMVEVSAAFRSSTLLLSTFIVFCSDNINFWKFLAIKMSTKKKQYFPPIFDEGWKRSKYSSYACKNADNWERQSPVMNTNIITLKHNDHNKL